LTSESLDRLKKALFEGVGYDSFFIFMDNWKHFYSILTVDYLFDKKPECNHLLFVKILDIINVSETPDKLKEFLKYWKEKIPRFAFDINSQMTNQALLSKAESKIFRPSEFKKFVNSWVDFGWKPSGKVSAFFKLLNIF
jgi:uncharacterized protein Usg